MDAEQFGQTIELMFGNLFAQFDEGEEFAFYDYGPKVINRIGYSTNISPKVIIQAADKKVDLIIIEEHFE
ncbi:hypothetical protein Back11_56840 [Paenibacillus baekrokdamisoli]|uniref:Uncharacterized protein n=1 Tax=Paenibacillus baekrokdamisoli TaxID=1712516 RepID=A0A3G9JMS2_9BACL|nr:hypothetical protein [Paenibacillus baekrokdamisoli]MBB3073437.1 hypothetical protein [Paenibacillus baekrokdamisoli]BBH24339.1 hypothetical protein Back11_56840 [Paenibacillus baekrokdamisoli]